MAMNPFGFLPKLPVAKPTANTRQFHFEAIAKKDLKDSIFIKNKIADETNKMIKTLDTKELEDLFATKSKEESAVKDDGPKKPEKTIVSLIDSKRSYNISLQLGSLRGLSYEDIRKAIIVMDEKVVNDGNIGTLKAIVPTQEEIDLVANYTGEDELAEPDKFFKVMVGLVSIPERLEAWQFKMEFMGSISKVRPDIENIICACKELKESKRLLKFLTIVLTVGNFLNGKSANKQAWGFKLKTLLKLGDTKSGDGKTSLLQYISNVVDKSYPELADFYMELEHIPLCTKILVSGMDDDVNKCKKGIELVEKHIKTAEDANVQGDVFAGTMRDFIEKAKTAISAIDEKWVDMMKALEETAVLYNEEKKDITKEPDKFFDVVNSFLNSYKQASEKNKKAKEEKEKKEKAEAEKKRKEEEAAKKKLAASSPAAKKDAPANQEGRGVVDQRGKGLKNGTLLRNKRKNKGGLEEAGSNVDSNSLNDAFAKLK